MKILVFIQQENGQINRISQETLVGAQKLTEDTSGELTALAFGTLPGILTGAKLDRVLVVDNPELSKYSPLHYVAALEQVFAQIQPDVVLVAHSYEARDWLPRVSARLDLPFLADCIGYKTDPQILFVRQVYQGKINADYSFTGPLMVSLQSGAFRSDELIAGSCSPETVTVDLSGVSDTIKPGEKFQEAKGTVDLSRATTIVAVGRGVGKEENMSLVQDLAEALDAEVGSSRPVVDYGWLPHDRQVGSSGQTVSPALYFALGISGAVQHQVGMKGSDHIVAINKDENAPIFEIADTGIVADLFELLPKLTEAIKAAR